VDRAGDARAVALDDMKDSEVGLPRHATPSWPPLEGRQHNKAAADRGLPSGMNGGETIDPRRVGRIR
jgi:hypothetical protein